MRPVNAMVTFVGIIVAALIAGAGREHAIVLLQAGTAGMLLGSSGNIINDVFDVEIDKINKPERALAKGMVEKRSAIVWGILCAVTGVTISAVMGVEIFFIALGSMILMYYYSAWLKRIPLLGNLVVGVLTGIAFLYGGYVVGNPAAGIVPALFACCFNFGREILKDVEDIEGDKAGKIKTFPLRFGVEASLTLTTLVFSFLIIGSILPYIFSLYSTAYFVTVTIGVDVVLFGVMYAMWKSPTTQTISRICSILKYDMLVGIAAIYLGSFS